MMDSNRSWSNRLRLTITTTILLVAAIATWLGLYLAGYGFAPELRSVVARPALVAVVAWWSLAAALPVVWVGDVRRAPSESLLLRFVIGTGFLALFVSAGNPLLIVVLLGVAALVFCLDSYAIARRAPGSGRARVTRAMAELSSYVVQLALTVALFLMTLVPLGWL
jgi:hypothetical protein